MKNIAIFVLSPFGKDDRPANDFTDATGAFHASTRQTNESCLRYLEWQLSSEGTKIDKAFAFVTPNMKENGEWECFCVLFPEIPIEEVPLRGKLLSDALESIPEMYDRLVAEQEATPDEEIRIHVDITGGFRHASMMMLPLIQILRYSGFTIGEVLYANLNSTPKMVEDASELANEFTLIGGAEEFVSFGSVRQIQRYFGGAQPPERLQALLDAMEQLEETLRVCGNYETTQAALHQLGQELHAYESAIRQAEDVSAQERFFSKLLPRIKQEYAPLFSREGRSTPAGIIRWCARKGLLQQAVTFYTEWMPPYLVDSHLLTVRDESIVEDCKRQVNLWSSWTIHLFRTYLPTGSKPMKLDEGQPPPHGMLMPFLQNGDFTGLMKCVRGREPKLEAFLAHVEAFCQHCNKFRFAQELRKLPPDDPIRQLMAWTTPPTTSLWNYVYKRVEKESSPEAIIVKALGLVPKEHQETFFTQKEDKTEKKASESKPQQRRAIFESLLESGRITTELPQEHLLDFVERYEMFVEELRHLFAHANADDGMVEGQAEIADAIEESLDLIGK